MGRIGLPEMIIILMIAVLIFGPGKLPDLGRGFGRAIREFKEAVRGGEKEPRPGASADDDKGTPLG